MSARKSRSDTCLICGVSEAEVKRVRSKDGYTLGCGIESNTEAGFDYEELSPRHRWRQWNAAELQSAGIKPEVWDKYRLSRADYLMWAACEDRVRGHVLSDGSEEDRYFFGTEAGQCITCGKKDLQPEQQVVEVCVLRSEPFKHPRETATLASFPPGEPFGQFACRECAGTAWWGYGPTPAECGPCVDCKGTGRVWVGLL